MSKLNELKVQAYDLISNIEWLQGKLREVNAMIVEEAKKEQENGGTNTNNPS